MIRFGLTFQEEMEFFEGSLSSQDVARVKSLAFPRQPTRELLEDTSRRSFRVMPFDDCRLLLTVVLSGQPDRFNRPAMRAQGCIIEPSEMQGSLRDLAAIWQALDSAEASACAERFEEVVSARSALVFEPVLEAMLDWVRENPSFASAATLALTRTQVVLRCAPTPSDVLASLRPLLLLLPLSHLLQLELSTETHYASGERVAGSTAPTPPPAGRLRSLRTLLPGGSAVNRVWVDLVDRQVLGLDGQSPRWFVDELINREQWPQLTTLKRYRILQDCIDAPVQKGRAITPWEVSSELASLLNVITRIENISRRLKKGEWITAPQRRSHTRGGE